MKVPSVIWTRRAVRVLPTNNLDRLFAYEAVLVVDKSEALLTAADCRELGEMLTAIGTAKETL